MTSFRLFFSQDSASQPVICFSGTAVKGYEGADMGAPTGHWWKTVQFIWIDQALKNRLN